MKKRKLWLLAISYWLLPLCLFGHQNGIDCKNKACRTMILTPISFTSNGKKAKLGVSLQGEEETFAKWKFVVPKGYPLDTNLSLGRPFITVNISCNVYEKGLTSETWPSPYAPELSISTYNPRTGAISPEVGGIIGLMDSGRNKITISQNFYINLLEDDIEIEVTLKRPGGEKRAPTILVNKNSLFLSYIFQKGEIPLPPDRYERNNDPSSATIILRGKVDASIWDGLPVKPVDVDWYKLVMENYGTFEIEITSSDEKSNLSPSLKLYNEKLKLLAQTKGIKTARIAWSGKGNFLIEVENNAGTEGPSSHNYILNIKK
ncbi:MAG: hypothetical protein AB1297_05010 [bacterium]